LEKAVFAHCLARMAVRQRSSSVQIRRRGWRASLLRQPGDAAGVHAGNDGGTSAGICILPH
jgi:hypothetical protein